MDAIGTNQNAVGHQFCIFAYHFWQVGIQAGSSRDLVGHQCQEAAKFIKQHFLRVLARFWVILAASRQVQTRCQKLENWCPTGSRLDPDCPKLVPKNAKLVPDCVPTASRLDPDWFSSIKRFAVLFPKFERLFLKF